MSLPLEEVRVHPAWSTVIELQTPNRQGATLVAKNRSGGPINIAYEVHGTGPIHLVVRIFGHASVGMIHTKQNYTNISNQSGLWG